MKLNRSEPIRTHTLTSRRIVKLFALDESEKGERIQAEAWVVTGGVRSGVSRICAG